VAKHPTRGKTSERGYGWRWQQEREHFLRAHPLCRFSEARGLLVSASVVDHVIPHRGDPALLWDQANWQPLCKPCHDSTKKLIEAGRPGKGCDVLGNPLHPDRHWR